MLETALILAQVVDAETVEAAGAQITGNLQLALAAFAIPLGIGLIGYKAVESVGRNPGAATPILVQSIIAMALAEAIIFFVIFLG
ncbi:MAG: ATP synthase F0 subunit C [Opitutales bacterium]|nr:ATP synthase F0 subunit C [Opitutales bacterium]